MLVGVERLLRRHLPRLDPAHGAGQGPGVLGRVRQGREEVKAALGPRALMALEARELDEVPRPLGHRSRLNLGVLGTGPGTGCGPHDEEREEL